MSKIDTFKKLFEDEKYKYISFDVFDTLIVRNYMIPSDLFFDISNDEHDKLKIYRDRIKAETVKRIKNNKIGKKEVTLWEIYQEIKHVNKIDYLENEIKLEYENCKSRKSVKEIYEHAVKNNKKIICISDMYLSKDIIKNILTINGYTEIEEIFVSSELNLTKHNGDIFKFVLNQLNIKKDEIIHIGDDLRADYINPMNEGITSIYYKKCFENFIEYLKMKKTLKCYKILLAIKLFPPCKHSKFRKVIANFCNTYFDYYEELRLDENCKYIDRHLDEIYTLIKKGYYKTFILNSFREIFKIFTNKLKRYYYKYQF